MIIFFRHLSGRRFTITALMIAVLLLPAVATAQDKLIDVMADELQREMRDLQEQETPPYFMSYMVGDVHTTSIRASFGALTQFDESDSRILTVEVRVGDYQQDNTHELRDQYDYSTGSRMLLAHNDNPHAIRTAIWQETNSQYRQAVERFNIVKANIAIKVAEEDTSADFSHITEPVTFYEPPVDSETLLGDMDIWKDKVKKYSALLLGNTSIYGGQAAFRFSIERKHLVTSEGTCVAQNLMYARLSVSGFIKSDDGMELPLYKSYFAFMPDNLPKDEDILADTRNMIKKLEKLRDAPVVDPYTGPAILSGRAAGVFFHEILGHRVEGHRLKSEYEGQTFKKQIGEKILPDHLNVIFEPTCKDYNGHDLMGYYQYDDEGVRAQKVSVVESGVLRNFLMSRSPIENFPESNGHGRAQTGNHPVSRQSNLIVKTSHPLQKEKLRAKLIELCKQQGQPFGLLFQDIQGGLTFTGRTIPNVFNLLPTEVYRVYTDGRPDELVRGVDLVGTPLVMFSMISEAGEMSEIFNGLCGAESGYVPVSAVSPSLLVTQVEVQKKSKSQERPPILPRPDSDN